MAGPRRTTAERNVCPVRVPLDTDEASHSSQHPEKASDLAPLFEALQVWAARHDLNPKPDYRSWLPERS